MNSQPDPDPTPTTFRVPPDLAKAYTPETYTVLVAQVADLCGVGVSIASASRQLRIPKAHVTVALQDPNCMMLMAQASEGARERVKTLAIANVDAVLVSLEARRAALMAIVEDRARVYASDPYIPARSGYMVRDVRTAGRDAYDVWTLDTGLLTELRNLEMQAAKLTGTLAAANPIQQLPKAVIGYDPDELV